MTGENKRGGKKYQIASASLMVVLLVVGVFSYTTITRLQSENRSLQTQYDQLTSDDSMLQSVYASLVGNYAVLQQSDARLKLDYDKLKADYASLQAKVPKDKGILIDSLEWNRGQLSQAGITAIAIRNLGSADVHIISLKLYYNQTLQSSASPSVVLSGNSTYNIKTFLPPAVKDPSYLYVLRVETLEGYTATSDPLPLCQ